MFYNQGTLQGIVRRTDIKPEYSPWEDIYDDNTFENRHNDEAAQGEYRNDANRTLFPSAEQYEFSFYLKPISNTTPKETTNLAKVLEMIKSRVYEKEIISIRAEKDETIQKWLKENTLPYVTFSGIFNKRDKDFLHKYCPLICIDIDYLSDKGSSPEILKKDFANDKYIYAAFTTPRGNGVKALLQVPPIKESHEYCFKAAEFYFQKKYGLKIDATGDLSRACFLSSDEDLIFNPMAEVFTSDVIEDVLDGEKNEEGKASNAEINLDSLDMRIAKLNLPQKILDLIERYAPAGKRSEADMSIMNSLKWHGATRKLTHEIFETKPCGGKFREKGASRESYFNITWDKVETSYAEEHGKAKAENKEVRKYEYTHLGVAERMADLLKRTAFYCHEKKQWIFWDANTKQWHWDIEKKIAEFYVNAVIPDIWRELQNFPAPRANDKSAMDNLNQLTRFYKASQQKPYQDFSIAECADTQREVKIQLNRLDKHPTWLSVANGVIDLKTGECMENKPEFLITRHSPVVFDPEAKCPMWEKEVELFFSGKADKINYFKRLCGYALTAGNGAKVFPILIGERNTGKSQFIHVMEGILGADLCGTIGKQNIIVTKNGLDYKKDEFQTCIGRRSVFSTETDEMDVLSEGIVKAWTGGDAIKNRQLHSNDWSDAPLDAKLFLVTNYAPKIKGQDRGIWSRVKLIRFEHIFEGASRIDNFYENCLKNELSGILNWMIEGAKEYFASGTLGECKEVEHDSKMYRLEQNPVLNFYKEHLKKSPQGEEQSTALYNNYKNYAKEAGEYAVSQKIFTMSMKNLGIQSAKKSRANCFIGIEYVPKEVNG